MIGGSYMEWPLQDAGIIFRSFRAGTDVPYEGISLGAPAERRFWQFWMVKLNTSVKSQTLLVSCFVKARSGLHHRLCAYAND